MWITLINIALTIIGFIVCARYVKAVKKAMDEQEE